MQLCMKIIGHETAITLPKYTLQENFRLHSICWTAIRISSRLDNKAKSFHHFQILGTLKKFQDTQFTTY